MGIGGVLKGLFGRSTVVPTAPATTPFEAALALTTSKSIEGGFANEPGDKGGPTNHGVTQRTYDLYRDKIGQFRRDVRMIEEREVRDVYLTLFWIPNRLDRFTRKLAMCCFDACINHRPNVWAKLLQRAVGVADDGRVGPITMKAVQAQAESDVIKRFLDERRRFYYAIVAEDPSQSKFLNGWLNRVARLRAALI